MADGGWRMAEGAPGEGMFARESTRMGANEEGRGSFRPQISQISTDGKGVSFVI